MNVGSPTAGRDRLIALADALFLIGERLRVVDAGRSGSSPPTEDDVRELCSRAALPTTAARALRAAVIVDEAAGAADRARLFDGPTACPPNETAWIRRDKGHLIGDIAGFYRAFGFRVATDAGEKADHIVAEIQFVAILLAMIARAAEAGESEHETVARQALAAFASDHVGAWIEPFCERLAATAEREEHRALALALVGVWSSVVGAAEIATADAVPEGPPPGDDGTPYECDGCP